MDSFSNYRQSLRFLFSRINYERISTSETSKQGFQLGRMHDLLSRLGNPHLEQRIIHVAGSKGKGSTAGMIASILQSAGYRTALFSSPHLYRIEERFSINKHPASTAQFTELITHIRPHVEQMDRESVGPTYFEITTAMAFLHFSNNLADELGWKVIDEAPNSLIALVAEEDWDGRVMDFGDPLTGQLEPSFTC